MLRVGAFLCVDPLFQIRTPKKPVRTAYVTSRPYCDSIRLNATTMAVYAEMAGHDNVLKRFRNGGFDCLCGNVRMAARSLTSIYDEYLKASGLRATQLAVLWAVVALDGGTVGKIAKAIAMDDSSLTRTLKLLERDKLVSLVAGSDRREKRVKATARGRKAFSAAMPLWQQAQSEVLRRLGGTRSRSRRLQDVNSMLLSLSSSVRV